MKKLVLLLLLAIFILPVNAQFEKHEISASYGLVTTDQIVDLIEDVIISIFTLGNFEKDDYSYSGALFLTYKYGITYRLEIGGTLGMDRVQGNLLWNDELQGNFRESHTTLALELTYRWVKQDFINLYSGFGSGYTFTNNYAELLTGETETINTGHPAIQMNLLGLRLGKKIAVFTELGFGYKGIINFGASFKF